MLSKIPFATDGLGFSSRRRCIIKLFFSKCKLIQIVASIEIGQVKQKRPKAIFTQRVMIYSIIFVLY